MIKKAIGLLLLSFVIIATGWTQEKETLRDRLEREVEYMLRIGDGWTKVSVGGWHGSAQVWIGNEADTILYSRMVTEDDKDYKGDLIIMVSPDQFDGYLMIEVTCLDYQNDIDTEWTIAIEGKNGVHMNLTAYSGESCHPFRV